MRNGPNEFCRYGLRNHEHKQTRCEIFLAGMDPVQPCNDPPVFAQVRLLISMIDRFVPVFSCPGPDAAGVGCKTQSSH
jgi:hypothetical protein